MRLPTRWMSGWARRLQRHSCAHPGAIEASVLSNWVLRAGPRYSERGRVLNERGDAKMVQRPGIVEVNIHLFAARGTFCAVKLECRQQFPHGVVIGDFAATVLTCTNLADQTALVDRQHYIEPSGPCGQQLRVNFDPKFSRPCRSEAGLDTGATQGRLRTRSGHRALDTSSVRTTALPRAADHHLRRVLAIQVHRPSVVTLSLRPLT